MTDPAKNNAALLLAGEKMRNEREDRLREISDLKNAKEELRDAISKIAIKLHMTSWVHPAEVVNAVESVTARAQNAKAERDDWQEVFAKIFRMVKGTGPVTPKEVLAQVYRFTSAGSNGTASDLSQQLTAEVEANVELRKELEHERENTKTARAMASAIKEEARIAMQTAQHWKQQNGTTESALRLAQAANRNLPADYGSLKRALEEATKERNEIARENQRHRADVAAATNELATVHDTTRKLQSEVLQLKSKLTKSEAESAQLVNAKQPYASGAKYKALRGGVLKALRSALEQVKNGGVSEENSARYNSAFNKGMKAGASIVEVEIYNALPAED